MHRPLCAACTDANKVLFSLEPTISTALNPDGTRTFAVDMMWADVSRGLN